MINQNAIAISELQTTNLNPENDVIGLTEILEIIFSQPKYYGRHFKEFFLFFNILIVVSYNVISFMIVGSV